MNKIDLDYKYYIERVMFSSNPHDRHILSIKQSDVSCFDQFKIGKPFSKEEFIEKTKTNEFFANRWIKK